MCVRACVCLCVINTLEPILVIVNWTYELLVFYDGQYIVKSIQSMFGRNQMISANLEVAVIWSAS